MMEMRMMGLKGYVFESVFSEHLMAFLLFLLSEKSLLFLSRGKRAEGRKYDMMKQFFFF